MKLKSVLLGTAVIFVTSVTAQAADVSKSVSKYVNVCAEGSYNIGGSNCLSIDGRVRFEYHVDKPMYENTGRLNIHDDEFEDDEDDVTAASDRAKELDFDGLSATGRVDFTVISATDMGPLKGFIRVEETGVTNAYLQWAGLTAGKTDSFFGFSKGLGEDEAPHYTGTWDDVVPLIAYTFDAGSGISITGSVEKRDDATFVPGSIEVSGTERAYGIRSVLNMSNAFLEEPLDSDEFKKELAEATASLYRLPDFVLDVEVTQDWGSAGVSAVYTGLRVIDFADSTKVLTKAGYAVAGGVSINVPGVEGLSLSARGTYGVGAEHYVGDGKIASAYYSVDSDGDYELVATKAWDVGAGATMAITDTLSANVAVSYLNVDQEEKEKIDMRHYNVDTCSAAAPGAPDLAETLDCLNSTTAKTTAALATDLVVSAGVTWKPVSDLAIGLEGYYSQAKYIGYGLYNDGDPVYAIDGDAIVVADDAVSFDEEEKVSSYGGSLTITRSF